MLQHKYLLEKIGFDKAENEPSTVFYKGLTHLTIPLTGVLVHSSESCCSWDLSVDATETES